MNDSIKTKANTLKSVYFYLLIQRLVCYSSFDKKDNIQFNFNLVFVSNHTAFPFSSIEAGTNNKQMK